MTLPSWEAGDPGRPATETLAGATNGDFEHGLNAAVNRLRETLGDSATDPKYIETIPRRGYRFVAFSVGLSVLSLDSMERAPVNTGCNYVQTPAFSPRGDYLVWQCAEKISNVSIHLQRLSDGSVTQLLNGIDAYQGDGMVDSRIVFSTPISGGDLWEVALARPHHPEKLPIGHDADDIAVSPAGKRLAFMHSRNNANIWRVDLSEPSAPARKLPVSVQGSRSTFN